MKLEEVLPSLWVEMTTKRRVITYEYPTIRIDDWDVVYNPVNTKHPWLARQASRSIQCADFNTLMAWLREDANATTQT